MQENVTCSHIAHHKTQNTQNAQNKKKTTTTQEERGGSLFTYSMNSYQHRPHTLFIALFAHALPIALYPYNIINSMALIIL